MPLVSVTRLRIRSWRYLPIFFLQANRSGRQAAAAEGSLTVRVLQDRRNTFWTATVWTDEQAMRRYMTAGVHGRVMRKLLDWCDEAAVAHWTQPNAELPGWPELHARLQTEGRRSKVRFPSAAHTAFTFSPPPRSDSEFRLK